MNKVFIIGRLSQTPESKQTPNGVSVTTFTVAVSRRYNREQTDFINVVAWRQLADLCSRYLVKGQQVGICGEIQSRSYEAKDGTKRYVTEVVADEVEFLGKKQTEEEQPSAELGGFLEYEDDGECPF